MKLFEVTNTTCMRKSANRNAQISVIHSAHCPDLCFAICRFSHAGCVCHLEQLHAQSPFLFPIVFSINLIPFFDICSVLSNFFITVLSPGLFGRCRFAWATAAARSQQLLFVVLAAGLCCFTAGCHIKSPLFPQPLLKQKRAPRRQKA